jgi:hypothetical protein
MKRLLLISVLLVIISNTFGQFFKPVPRDLFSNVTADSRAKGSSIWLPRPSATISAVQWNYDKDAKTFNAIAFQSVGLGVGYQHFIEANGVPYNNYGFNALMLLGTDISAAVTCTALGIINAGICYNITLRQFGVLTGVQIRF